MRRRFIIASPQDSETEELESSKAAVLKKEL
jgi:hypothetical protein